MGNTAVVSWGFRKCPYIETGTVGRLFLCVCLGSVLSYEDETKGFTQPQAQQVVPHVQCQGTLAHLHWQLPILGDKLLI